MPVTIRPAKTIDDCRVAEQLQADIWQADPREVIPDHMLITAAKNGGVLLLAEDAGEAIGFVFGFTGFSSDGDLKHCSHQLGIVSERQGEGIGYQLKLAQREIVLAQGVTLMTWTFDPMLGLNARFNMRKLGTECWTYFENQYGDMRDGLNRGWPSDRLEATWRLDSRRTKVALAGKNSPPAFDPALVLNPASGDLPCQVVHRFSRPAHFVELPTDTPGLRQRNPAAALAWRLQLRHLLQEAFAQGYRITDFVRHQAQSFYYLVR